MTDNLRFILGILVGMFAALVGIVVAQILIIR